MYAHLCWFLQVGSRCSVARSPCYAGWRPLLQTELLSLMCKSSCCSCYCCYSSCCHYISLSILIYRLKNPEYKPSIAFKKHCLEAISQSTAVLVAKLGTMPNLGVADNIRVRSHCASPALLLPGPEVFMQSPVPELQEYVK